MSIVELRVAGFGGQGVILSAMIIGRAVSIFEDGFATLTQMIPALIFHAVAMFLGMVFIGLGQRARQQAA